MKIQGNTKERLKKFHGLSEDSLAIHGGQEPDPVTGAVMPPIYQTSTFAQNSPAQPIGEYEYSRSHNPTRRALEDCLALLEGGTYGFATSSGMSATQLLLGLLSPGDEIICGDDVYGGMYRILTTVAKRHGISTKFLNFSTLDQDPTLLEKNVTDKTRLVWLETPTNPNLKIFDIRKIAAVCKKRKLLLCVDNTFMTPIFQRPLDLGANIVMHSLSKYIGGHSDTIAGALITNDDDLAEKLYVEQNSVGAICPPFDSWMLLRSLKTLPVRMRAHQENALHLATWLEKHERVEKVIYPGLKSHPHHVLAREQMKGFGGMLSFTIKGDLETARGFFKKLELFTLAESLGAVESLIEHPALMTHASLPPHVRQELGISDTFIRVSVGLEDIEDLKKDLDQALR